MRQRSLLLFVCMCVCVCVLRSLWFSPGCGRGWLRRLHFYICAIRKDGTYINMSFSSSRNAWFRFKQTRSKLLPLISWTITNHYLASSPGRSQLLVLPIPTSLKHWTRLRVDIYGYEFTKLELTDSQIGYLTSYSSLLLGMPGVRQLIVRFSNVRSSVKSYMDH